MTVQELEEAPERYEYTYELIYTRLWADAVFKLRRVLLVVWIMAIVQSLCEAPERQSTKLVAGL